jgi:hypothetical protein
MSVLSWGPCVLKTKVPTDLVDELVSRRSTKSPANKDLAGHFEDQYFFEDNDKQWFLSKFGQYADEYLQADANRLNRPKEILTPDFTTLWINYMKAGDFNPPHLHYGAASFVLFGECPTTLETEVKEYKGTGTKPGQLCFMWGDAGNQFCTVTHNFTPTKGDLFIFPSNLTHYVAPFKSEGTRVSVSGNIIFHNNINDKYY